MKALFESAIAGLQAARTSRLSGAESQTMTTSYMKSAAAMAFLAFCVIPFTATAQPVFAEIVALLVLILALYCQRLSDQGFPVRAVKIYGPILWALVVVPFLVFGRSPAFCALIIFSIVPLYVAVVGLFAASVYVLSFFASAIAFALAIAWGFDPPVYFPLGSHVQIIIAGLAAAAALFPTQSLLNGIQTERLRTEREIEERKAAEKALEALSQSLSTRLAESESVLRSAIDAIGEAFVVFDPHDRLSYCNEEYRQAYRFSAPVIQVGRTFEEIVRYGAQGGQYPDAEGRVEEWVQQRLAEHQQGNTNLTQELKDGRWLKILERKTSTGHTVGFRVDVTELYRAKEAAEAASSAKGQFLATMSHEIRTPMNGMMGMAQVLLNPDLPYHERQDAAQAILRSGQSMLGLLNDLLDFSKIEYGKVELRMAEFSPVSLVDEVVQLFRNTAHMKKVFINTDTHLGLERRFHSDVARVRQMLTNLVGNAVKFTSKGSITVEVWEVENQGNSALLEFSVTDTGPGVSESDIKRLFQPFAQLDGSATRKYVGSGLGLYIVKNLAELMDGSAGVDSEPGFGSRFWFRVRAEVLQDANSISRMMSLSSEINDEGPLIPQLLGHVLVCDDDGIHRKVIESVLTRLGLTFVNTENGEEAFQKVCSGEHFDLIIMDVNMPVMDGLAATRKIRQWEVAHLALETPVLAITASVFDDDVRQCREAGMSDFLSKPIYFKNLATALEKWLPIRRKGTLKHAPRSQKGISASPESLNAMVQEMLPFLAMQSYDAFGRFKMLKSAAEGSTWETEVQEIDQLLQNMQFPIVIQRLEALVSGTTTRISG